MGLLCCCCNFVNGFAKRHPGVLVYKSPKFIRVDNPWVSILHKSLVLSVILFALVQLYFNDGWALSEVPTGFVASKGTSGGMLVLTNNPNLASITPFCDNASHAYTPYALSATPPVRTCRGQC